MKTYFPALAASLALSIIAADTSFAATTTITGTASGANSGSGNNDNWNNAANWDFGIPGSNGVGDSAIIPDNFTAGANGAALVYNGGLTMGANSTLRIGRIDGPTDSKNAVGQGTLTMNTGALLRITLKSNVDIPVLNLLGNADIRADSTQSHSRNYNIAGIGGSGDLTLSGTNRNRFFFNGNGSGWSGDLIVTSNSNNNTAAIADENNAFGSGDVTIESGTGLIINSGLTDVIGDSAILTFNGVDAGDVTNNSTGSKFILNSDETVGQLWIDGVQQAPGDYTSASGLTDFSGNPLLTGSGTLTVLPVPEPGSLALLGLGGLLVARRRRG